MAFLIFFISGRMFFFMMIHAFQDQQAAAPRHDAGPMARRWYRLLGVR